MNWRTLTRSSPLTTLSRLNIRTSQARYMRFTGIELFLTKVHLLRTTIVLDDADLNANLAHIIRRQATIFYKSCFDLSAVSRWCLSGTPIQNRLEDIGTLFAFIRARPFHSLATFRQYIVTPFEEGEARRELACRRLVTLLDSLCLRRTKDLLHLPDQINRVIPVRLTAPEREQYERTKTIMERIIRQKAGIFDRNNKFGLFQANLQLRIFCNHGTFQRYFSWSRSSQRDIREAVISAVGHDGELVCSGCKLPMPVLGSSSILKAFAQQCAHVLCSECLEATTASTDVFGQKICPLCVPSGISGHNNHDSLPGSVTPTRGSNQQALLIRKGAGAEEDDDHYFQSQGYSSKMEALVKDVKTCLWSTKR